VYIAYCILAIIYSGLLTFPSVAKLQQHPQAVQILHELIGVPLECFPVLCPDSLPTLFSRFRFSDGARSQRTPEKGHPGRGGWV